MRSGFDIRLLLELAIIVGCFVVILVEPNPATETAAFGLLGVIVASIVHNLSRGDPPSPPPP